MTKDPVQMLNVMLLVTSTFAKIAKEDFAFLYLGIASCGL